MASDRRCNRRTRAGAVCRHGLSGLCNQPRDRRIRRQAPGQRGSGDDRDEFVLEEFRPVSRSGRHAVDPGRGPGDARHRLQSGEQRREDDLLGTAGSRRRRCQPYSERPRTESRLAPRACRHACPPARNADIAKRCNLQFDFKNYHFPKFDTGSTQTADALFEQKVREGFTHVFELAKARNPKIDEKLYSDRLEYEISVITKMGFAGYFLIVSDFIHYAKKSGIPVGPGRGSAAGSLVAYSLGITNLDPIDHGLIFERFLNPGRVSMPDIDLDFPDDRRSEMMGYCADRYGHDKVAQIITFGTLKARAAVRDVGRVMDIPLEEVDRVAKLIPAIPGKPVKVEEAIEQVPDLKKLYNSNPRYKEMLDTAKHMEGVVRNAGTHAAAA